MQAISAIQLVRALLAERLKSAECIVDATAGNGNDTLYLAESSPVDAAVFAFDIQPEALAATQLKTEAFKAKIHYILASHAELASYVTAPIDVAVFNLGYLPGGNHAVTTLAATTLAALAQIVPRLAAGGLTCVIAYPGHEAGKVEARQTEEYLAALPVKNFTVGCYRMINHRKDSPVLYIIEKVRS